MKLEGSSIARICRHLPAFAVRSAGDVGPFYSWAKGWDHNSGDGKTCLLFIILFFQFLWWGQSNQKLLKEDLCRALWEVSISCSILKMSLDDQFFGKVCKTSKWPETVADQMRAKSQEHHQELMNAVTLHCSLGQDLSLVPPSLFIPCWECNASL